MKKREEMANTFFNGEKYYDDRLFLLHICKCTVSALDNQMLETTIYHAQAPAEHLWCLVTYRNVPGYPATRVDHFQSYDEARAYLEITEPTVPLISLGGNSPSNSVPYKEFVTWKAKNEFEDYDYRSVYLEGGEDHREVVLSQRR